MLRFNLLHKATIYYIYQYDSWLMNVEMDMVNTDLLKTDYPCLDHLRGVYRNEKTKRCIPLQGHY